MGNAQSNSSIVRHAGALDTFVGDLNSDVVYEHSLGSARFLRTVKCRHNSGFVVVKIFIKADPGLSLRTYRRKLQIAREALQDVPNVYSYQVFIENDKAGYLIRQWIASNLYDRISTRPFLSTLEKLWITYQLLTALRDSHARKLPHGDIKSENVLVTSSNWIYLTDYASNFKPTMLPLDNPGDFAYFFDTSGRRNCYVAPERFFAAGDAREGRGIGKKDKAAEREKEKVGGGSTMIEGSPSASTTAGVTGRRERDGKVTEAMDVFSAGCVIAELLSDGAPAFSLSQLFKYRAGELKLDEHLSLGPHVEPSIRDMVYQMLSLDPASRPTFSSLLHSARGTIFPEYFYSYLHDFFSSTQNISSLRFPYRFNNLGITGGVGIPQRSPGFGQIGTGMGVGNAGPATGQPTNQGPDPGVQDALMNSLPSDSDHRLEKLWSEFDAFETHLRASTGTAEEGQVDGALDERVRPKEIIPVKLHLPHRDGEITNVVPPEAQDGMALIMLTFICANMRNAVLQSSKLRAMDMLLALSVYLSDEVKLDRLVPYFVDMFQDKAPLVRASALRSLLQTLVLVNSITPFNSAIFSEYIFPRVRELARDPDPSVRSMIAQSMVPLAMTAQQYLEMGQVLKMHASYLLTASVALKDNAQISYDVGVEDLQRHAQDLLSTLLMDSSGVVKRSLLRDVSSLCIFLGRQRTNDVLLSHMITYLNDRDWLLRYAFFESVTDVAACLGGRSLEEYILPLMTQALSDTEESVVNQVLSSLTGLCELGLIKKMRLWELVSATLAFLYHPNIWIREGAAAFVAASAKAHPMTDVWCILYPSLKHFLRSEVTSVDVRSVLTSLKSPLPRRIFDASLEWAVKAPKSRFWRSSTRTINRAEKLKDAASILRADSKAGLRLATKSEEDVHRLESMGVTAVEEPKLLVLRDLLLKLASAADNFKARSIVEPDTQSLKFSGGVELQKLGVVPRTVFLESVQNNNRAPALSPASSNEQLLQRTIKPSDVLPHDTSESTITIKGGVISDIQSDIIERSSTSSRLDDPFQFAPPPLRSRADTTSRRLRDDTRPASPSAESTTSISSSFPYRFQASGLEGQRASAAVGSVRANAIGVFGPGSNRAHLEVVLKKHSGSTTSLIPDSTQAGGQLPRSLLDSKEPAVVQLLEKISEETDTSLLEQFGPRISRGPIRNRANVRSISSMSDERHRTLNATLISHLNAHSGPINGVAVSSDHVFFVSCSDDKTVKVWDSARLERNVTGKARQTYTQHRAKVKCICMLEASHCFASAGEDGSLHVVRVHVQTSGSLPKYLKSEIVREYHLERPGEYITCLTHFIQDNASIVAFATTHSSVVLLDLRTMKVRLSMSSSQQHGPITSMCIDNGRSWLVTASLHGVLCLWDIRFGLLLRSWSIAHQTRGRSARIIQVLQHPGKGSGRWILVSLDTEDMDGQKSVLMEVWDIENNVLVDSISWSNGELLMGGREDSSPQSTLQDPLAAFIQSYRKDASYENNDQLGPSDCPIISAMAFATDNSGMSVMLGHHSASMTRMGSTDSFPIPRSIVLFTSFRDAGVQLWNVTDLGKPKDENNTPSGSQGRGQSNARAVDVVQLEGSGMRASNISKQHHSSMIMNHQSSLLKGHSDSVRAMACIDSPFRGGLVTADQAGIVKVWRMDLTDSK